MYSGKTVQRVKNKNTLYNLFHPRVPHDSSGRSWHGERVDYHYSHFPDPHQAFSPLSWGLVHGLLRKSAHHLSLREIVIHGNGSVAPLAQLAPYVQSTNANYTRKHRHNLLYIPWECSAWYTRKKLNAVRDILETDGPGIDGKCSENVFPRLRNTVHGSNLYFINQIPHEMEIDQWFLDQLEHSFLQGWTVEDRVHVHPLLCSSFVHSWIWRFVKVRHIQHPTSRFTKLYATGCVILHIRSSPCWDYSTCDAVALTTAIVNFCFCTDKCRVYLFDSPMSMQSSSHMGSVPKIPWRTHILYSCRSRGHKQEGT